MALLLSRNSLFGPRFGASIVAISNGTRPVQSQEVLPKETITIEEPDLRCRTEFFNQKLSNKFITQSGHKIDYLVSQKRLAHTDVTKVPSFDEYRHKDTLDPTSRSSDTKTSRKMFYYATLFGGSVAISYGAKNSVRLLLGTLNPSARVLIESTLEVDLSEIPEGKNMVFKWRNKPLFIRHRTADEIETVRAVDETTLADPAKDEHRVQKDQWLILVGICTHLGCVPIANAGDFGGYYCPCHGSHYDASGRIRKGPAPANLEVPEYKFLTDTTVLVG